MVQAKMGGSYELEIGSNEPLGRGVTLLGRRKIYTRFVVGTLGRRKTFLVDKGNDFS